MISYDTDQRSYLLMRMMKLEKLAKFIMMMLQSIGSISFTNVFDISLETDMVHLDLFLMHY